jgi:hypothetical protein
MGCLRQIVVQIGCLVVLVAALVFGFLYREQIAAVYRRVFDKPVPAAADSASYALAGAGDSVDVGRTLTQLGRSRGPAYVSFTAPQVASIIEQRLGSARGVVDSVRVLFAEPEVRVRASLDMARVPRDALGGLGPFRGAMEGRQPVLIGGLFSADSAGRLLLTVTSLEVGGFPFPRGTIGAVLRALDVPDVRGRTLAVPIEQRVGEAAVRGNSLRLYRYEP